jgi:medium-chain acyl-[acyl-carrier-protein] hydrolase
MRADFELVDTYGYETEDPLSCPITAYGGLEDEFVSLESLCEWQKQTYAACRQRMFLGDHFFIHYPGNTFLNALRNDVMATRCD